MQLNDDLEFRSFDIKKNVDNEDAYKISGYAAVFEKETIIYNFNGIDYKEIIDKNAFLNTDISNVILNYNHSGKPVARTKNDTLKLFIDNIGLKIDADLSGTAEGRRLYEEIKGGYLDKMSFAFVISDCEYDEKQHLRRIKAIEKIFDVSVVDFPAYENTEVSARRLVNNFALKSKIKDRLNLKIKIIKGV